MALARDGAEHDARVGVGAACERDTLRLGEQDEGFLSTLELHRSLGQRGGQGCTVVARHGRREVRVRRLQPIVEDGTPLRQRREQRRQAVGAEVVREGRCDRCGSAKQLVGGSYFAGDRIEEPVERHERLGERNGRPLQDGGFPHHAGELLAQPRRVCRRVRPAGLRYDDRLERGRVAGGNQLAHGTRHVERGSAFRLRLVAGFEAGCRPFFGLRERSDRCREPGAGRVFSSPLLRPDLEVARLGRL
jgi:hypothetical protein